MCRINILCNIITQTDSYLETGISVQSKTYILLSDAAVNIIISIQYNLQAV